MKIKFLCLNLFRGGVFFDKVINFLKLENPDILALQEVYDGNDEKLPSQFKSIKILQANLPGFNFHFAPEQLVKTPYGEINQGNAIFSRFPIIKTKTVFFDIPYKTVDFDKDRNDFYKDPKNLQLVHLNSKLNLCVANLHGIWGLDGLDNPQRLKMSQAIIREIFDLKKIILAGDFNLKPNTQTINNIERHLVNIFKGQLTSSFNMKRKSNPGYATAVVDMIFVSRNIKIIEKRCPQVDISDHLPLLCTLEI